MKSEKTYKVLYWVSTIIIFLFEGVMPALTYNTQLAKDGIAHLGYPEYFGNALVVFKVLGTLAIIIPKVPAKLKEWAYAGFIFDFIFASISHAAVDGFNLQAVFPFVLMIILLTSYLCRSKIYHSK